MLSPPPSSLLNYFTGIFLFRFVVLKFIFRNISFFLFCVLFYFILFLVIFKYMYAKSIFIKKIRTHSKQQHKKYNKT